MTEVRMRLRQKGQQFPTQDLESFLLAFGDNDYPLPSTVRVLDEIITDYIIETCHEAASVAHHARRAKIKLDDFKFMLRRDTVKLGRVSDMLETDKELKRKRKAFDTDEGAVLGKGEEEGGAKGGDAGGKEDDGSDPADLLRGGGLPRRGVSKRPQRMSWKAGTVVLVEVTSLAIHASSWRRFDEENHHTHHHGFYMDHHQDPTWSEPGISRRFLHHWAAFTGVLVHYRLDR